MSPKLMAAYREGELSLDQLMAFALTDDHARQEEVWGALSWNKGVDVIRRLLTEGQVNSRDRRVAFVGLDAYEAAGGVMLRDLFAEDHGGWLTDSALLERLVREKLEAVAEGVRQEGWRWVDLEGTAGLAVACILVRLHRLADMAAGHADRRAHAVADAELEELDERRRAASGLAVSPASGRNRIV